MIALDTETSLLTPGEHTPRLACVSLAVGQDAMLTRSREVVADALTRGIVGHRIAYDTHAVLGEWPDLWPDVRAAYECDRITDTRLRAQLADLEDGRLGMRDYSLASMTAELGWQLDKDTWRLRYAELIGVPLDWWPEGAREYALDDARSTHALWASQGAGSPNQYHQARASFWLHDMERNGIMTDPAFVEPYLAYVQARRESITVDLQRAGLVRWCEPRKGPPQIECRCGRKSCKHGTTDTELLRQWAESKGVTRYTPTGQICTSAGVLVETGDPTLALVAERGSLTKILSEEAPILRSGYTTPIHPRYLELKETGRTGCTGPNLQNRPRRFGAREGFIPRPGYVFAIADYSGLELATWAQTCMALLGRSSMADRLNDGMDAHLSLAARLLGSSYADLVPRKKAGDPEVTEARHVAKQGNFGLLGGMGLEKFMLIAKRSGVELTYQQADELRRAWREENPECWDYFAIADSCAMRGSLVQIYSNRVRGGVGFTDAANSFFQGLGADLAKHAGWLLSCRQREPGPLFGTRTVLFPHDEFVLEVPEHRAHAAAVALAETMAVAARDWLPDVRLVAEPCLARRWSKSAKAVWQGGELVPWDVGDGR